MQCSSRPSSSDDDRSIDSLRDCVRALEGYAVKVRENEKASNLAHGRYRRAFIQTYALLSSVIDSNHELNRFKKTFSANHTNAAQALKRSLDAVKSEIGNDWADTPGSALEVAEKHSRPAVAHHVSRDAELNVDTREANDGVNGGNRFSGEKDEDDSSSDDDAPPSSFIELKTDGHLKKANATWHP